MISDLLFTCWLTNSTFPIHSWPAPTHWKPATPFAFSYWNDLFIIITRIPSNQKWYLLLAHGRLHVLRCMQQFFERMVHLQHVQVLDIRLWLNGFSNLFIIGPCSQQALDHNFPPFWCVPCCWDSRNHPTLYCAIEEMVPVLLLPRKSVESTYTTFNFKTVRRCGGVWK